MIEGLSLAGFGLEHAGLGQHLFDADDEVTLILAHGLVCGHQAEADHRVIPQAHGTDVQASGDGAVGSSTHGRMRAGGLGSEAGEQGLIQGLGCLRLPQHRA